MVSKNTLLHLFLKENFKMVKKKQDAFLALSFQLSFLSTPFLKTGMEWKKLSFQVYLITNWLNMLAKKPASYFHLLSLYLYASQKDSSGFNKYKGLYISSPLFCDTPVEIWLDVIQSVFWMV